MGTLKQTPLHAEHLALNARMVDFAGWDMPVLYGGILEEARAVRSACGIFDISHMGRTRIFGAGATEFLQRLTTNDVAALTPSQAHYSLLTNPLGGVIDDIIVYRRAEEDYLVVINASNTDKDLDWMQANVPDAVTIENDTPATAMIAVQGPDAPQLIADLAQNPALLAVGRFAYATGEIAGASATLCRTGYTGEDGFELIVPAERAAAVWQALIGKGAAACGLGARDALRIEAGYPLYGHEIDDTTTPVEAGLMWVVKMEKGEFTGRGPIAAMKKNGVPRKLMGLVSPERIAPRQGYTIYIGEQAVGTITSGIFSPTRNLSVAMGYIDAAHANPGDTVEVAARNKRIPATVVPKKTLLQAQA